MDTILKAGLQTQSAPRPAAPAVLPPIRYAAMAAAAVAPPPHPTPSALAHGGINTTHTRRDGAVTSAAACVDRAVNSPRGVRSTDARARAQHCDVVAEPHAALGDEPHALVRRVGVAAAGRLVLLGPGVACDVPRDVGVGAQGGRTTVAAARGRLCGKVRLGTMHMFIRLIIAPPAQM